MSQSQQKSSPLILALDTIDLNFVGTLAAELNPIKCKMKVGKELFTTHGPKAIELLHKHGFDVFLDLKFHDIPNTVAKACRVAADMGVWMLNVHAMGGLAMMEAAQEAIEKTNPTALLIAVTVLTSMDDTQWQQLGMAGSISEKVTQLAALSQQAGLSGVVCSAQEAALIEARCGPSFLRVTPGIRLATHDLQDQKRVMTPQQAKQAGVDYMVMGRPITESSDPVKAVDEILASMGSL